MIFKFRGWDKDDEKMHPWWVLRSASYNQDHCHPNENILDIWNAEEYTLMQFVGQQDKFGQDIYVGDYVVVPPYRSISFKYSEQVSTVIFKRGKFTLDCIADWEWNELWVIGNIFEGPK